MIGKFEIGRHEVILTGILLPNSCWVRIRDGLGKDRGRVVKMGNKLPSEMMLEVVECQSVDSLHRILKDNVNLL